MNQSRRIGIVHAGLSVLALAILGRTAHVQLAQGDSWAGLAERQHYAAREIPAPRGEILDADGKVLATSREMVRLEIAPRELRAPRRARAALLAAGVDAAVAGKAMERWRQWVVVPGKFVAEDVAELTGMRGVYTSPVSERAYATTSGLDALIGKVGAGGRPLDGLELALDSLLRGSAGASRMIKDARGHMVATAGQPGVTPRAGNTVALTINRELQEIAERSLADAVDRMNAEGGDIVIVDPRSGEILAMAGQRGNRPAPSLTAVNEPFEPGSTLKPLIAAGLLERGHVKPGDKVSARGGTYELHGRVIRDEPHEEPTPAQLSLADVIRYSSNVGIAQFAERSTEREQYETLRDFGFGTATGIQYASEASGTLRPPHLWSRQSQASLSMGYEMTVTPLQLALAYSAIANGGELLEPVLVREIRAPHGEVLYRSQRRVVRQVVSGEVAGTMRTLLTGVVESGTAMQAELATYSLGGKTGTPRRTVGGRYMPMQYNPNFVGLFPADAPQLVIVVKLTSPRPMIYGGLTAAPVTRTILQAALAGRNAAIDHSSLVPRQRGEQRQRAAVATAARTAPTEVVADTTLPAQRVSLPVRAEVRQPMAPPRAIPVVTGLTLRDAVRTLHSAGFRVQLTRDAASPGATDPPSGAVAEPGTLVRLRFSR